jgi:hypothetical protein
MMKSSEAERRVEEFSALIERQRHLIKQLEKCGDDVTSAKIIFDSLSVSLSLYMHERHRVHCHVEKEQPKFSFAQTTASGFTNNNAVELKSVLSFGPHATTQVALGRMSDRENSFAEIPSVRRADRKMTCAKCGDALNAPEWSDFLSARRIINLWSCTECGYSFVETLSEAGYSKHVAA